MTLIVNTDYSYFKHSGGDNLYVVFSSYILIFVIFISSLLAHYIFLDLIFLTLTINVTISRIVEGCYKITGMILKDQGILEGNFIL